MANDTYTFVFGHRRVPATRLNKHQLTVKFSVEIGAVPKNLVATTSLKIHNISYKTIQLPLDADDALRRRLISTAIASLDILFPMHPGEKSILWGTLTFPEEGAGAAFENLDEIKSGLCDMARGCADTGYMYVVIRRVDRVSQEDYQELLRRGKNSKKGGGPFSGWIKENANDVNLDQCVALLCTLSLHSPKDNKYFGLSSVRVEKESGEQEECSICLKDLKKGSEVIRMPCSHLFHGFCIFRWIRHSSSCPVCRSDLKLDRKLVDIH